MKRSVLTILFLLVAFSAQAKDLYVATTACSDATTYAGNNIDNPWCTVEKAWTDALDEDVVYYRAGTYTITAIINNPSSGSSVTHTSYAGEQAIWNSSLCSNNGVIHVSEDGTTVDGIDGNWTGLEDCYADTGFFILGYATAGGVASHFTLKNGTWVTYKYGSSGNGAIVEARNAGGELPDYLTIENIRAIGPGETYGGANSAVLLHCYEAINASIRNNEVSDGAVGIYFNKHSNPRALSAGVIENNYIHSVGIALMSQANNLIIRNNILDGGRLKMGGASGPSSIDGDEGSDFNTITHNTFGYTSGIEMFSGLDSASPYPGAQHNTFENNIFPAACDSFPGFSIAHHWNSDVPTYYEGDYNLLPTAGEILFNTTDYNMSELSVFLGGGCPSAVGNECHSLDQDPTFTGGTNPTTVSGFALASGSHGRNAASDGTDMGVDIRFVGVDATDPGPQISNVSPMGAQSCE